MKVVATHGQSIFDLAINSYGSVEGIFFLMDENGLSGLDAVVSPGTPIAFDKVKNVITQQPVVKYIPPDPKSKVVVESGHSIFDISLKNTGNIESIFDLLTDNASALDTVLSIGSVLKVNPGNKTIEPVFRYKPVNYSDIRKFIATKGQNMFDIALQLTGSVEGLFQLLENNSDIFDLDSDFAPGQQVLFNKANVVDKGIYNYLSDRSIRVNSGDSGVEFWITELGEFVIEINNNKVKV